MLEAFPQQLIIEMQDADIFIISNDILAGIVYTEDLVKYTEILVTSEVELE